MILLHYFFFSIRYIKMEMENIFNRDAAIFEVKLELQKPHLIYIPSLEPESKNGFFALLEELIMDIYSMCDIIPRVAQPEIASDTVEASSDALNVSEAVEEEEECAATYESK